MLVTKTLKDIKKSKNLYSKAFSQTGIQSMKSLQKCVSVIINLNIHPFIEILNL